ncbi:MAG: hypothetical protein AAF963_03465 [Bacteroidota bacterium]
MTCKNTLLALLLFSNILLTTSCGRGTSHSKPQKGSVSMKVDQKNKQRGEPEFIITVTKPKERRLKLNVKIEKIVDLDSQEQEIIENFRSESQLIQASDKTMGQEEKIVKVSIVQKESEAPVNSLDIQSCTLRARLYDQNTEETLEVKTLTWQAAPEAKKTNISLEPYLRR